MRQNLFSLWASSRLTMETTERQVPGIEGNLISGAGPHFCKCQTHCVPPTMRIQSPGLGESGVGVGGRQGPPDRVLTMFPTSIGRTAWLYSNIVYRGVASWPRHPGGAEIPRIIAGGRGGSQCWCLPGTAVLAMGGLGAGPAPPSDQQGAPSILPGGVPWAPLSFQIPGAFSPWVLFMCFGDHFCIVRSEKKIF